MALSGPIADLFITEDSENLYEKLTKDAQEYLGIESSLLDDILLKFSQMVPELEALFDIDLHQCHMPSGILEQANEALMLRNLEAFRLADKRQSSSSVKRELIEKKEDDAAVDPLTGLFSKNFLEHYLEEIFQRCDRTGMSMSIALAVLDNFDPISKKHGRPICDDILIETAQLLEGAVRAGDVIARYGDEVFAIALPGVNTVTANEICKRFANTRKSLSHRIKLGRSLPVTLSMAVVTHNDGIKFTDSNTFMEAVNSTLYKAKLEGSNSLLQYTAEAANN